jgi:hypothetical protein
MRSRTGGVLRFRGRAASLSFATWRARVAVAIPGLSQLVFEFLDLGSQIQHLDTSDALFQDGHCCPDFRSRLPAGQVAPQRIHGIRRRLLKPGDGALDNLAACLAKRPAKLREGKPVLQGSRGYPGLDRGCLDGGLSHKRGDGRFPLSAQFLSMSSH